jgi:hypothetical protein
MCRMVADKKMFATFYAVYCLNYNIACAKELYAAVIH